MIAEAIDTAFTLGWALAAWIVLTAAVATAGLWTVAVTAWWIARTVKAAAAALYARWRLSGARKAVREGRSPERPSRRPLRLRPAPVPQPAPGATGPSRHRARRCTASQSFGGPDTHPHHPGPSSARTAPSWANTQPIKES